MNDGDVTDRQPTLGHLADEQLSAHLDGEATLEGAGHRHLEGCTLCRRRLAVLAEVRGRVRASVVPPEPELRAAAMAAIVDAVTQGTSHRRQVPRARPGRPHAPRAAAQSRVRARVVTGVAAALVALAVGIGVPLGLASRSSAPGNRQASHAPSTSAPFSPHPGALGPASTVTSASGVGGAALGAQAGVVDVGTTDSLATLRARLSAQVSARESGASPFSSAPGDVAAPSSAPDSAASAPFEHCLGSAERAAGPHGDLLLLASTVFRGVPGLVYVFGPTGATVTAPTTRDRAVVIARTGCGLLATASV